MADKKPRRLNLLVVDDDPSIVRLATAVLEGQLTEKLAVHGFCNAREALDWIDRNCCDILLSDIEMPGVDGLELMRLAKKRNAWTQVIFLTGHSTWDRIATALENGASDYLLKPLDRHELVNVVSQHQQRFVRWQLAVRDTLAPREPAGAV